MFIAQPFGGVGLQPNGCPWKDVGGSGGVMIKTKGIIVPVDWNEEGVAVSFAVSTFDEDEYVLESRMSREEMVALIREEVEVSGELGMKSGKKTIVVSAIDIMGRAVA
jgi:hypothetical protein